MKIYKILFVLLFPVFISAQLITWEPVFLTPEDSVTVYYDATLGSGGLEDYNGDVYAHTGLITSLSTSDNNWRYVITDWAVNKPKIKLDKVGDNLYRLTITPSIIDYYITSEGESLQSGETIEKLAFVFRNADGSFEGKTESGEDIFIDLGVGINILQPIAQPYNAQIGETFDVVAVGSNITDTLKLYLSDQLIATTTEDTLVTSITANEFKEWITVIGKNTEGLTMSDSFYYFVNPDVVIEELPAGIEDGINIINNSTVTLSFYAQNKDFVYVIGDFNNWEIDPAYFMKQTPDGSHYWITLEEIEPGVEYGFQYLIEGTLRLADPYTEKVLDPWNDRFIPESVYPDLKPYPSNKTQGIVSLLETARDEYQWEVENFERPDPDDLVIYELLIRDFVSTHSYDTLIDTLSYLETLGINAIELMPVNEFEGNSSWGYNPSFMFAVDKYYGTRNDLRRFIDECHKRGIAVIFDMVLNHQFGQSPLVQLYWDSANNRPSAENPWFNQVPKHDFNVGYDMNHESKLTQQFVDRVNRYWLEEFNFDGFRFDLSKGFMQTGSFYDYNQSRIDLLKRMYDKVREYDNDAYMILEHLGANNEEIVLSDYGFMLWGKMTDPYNEATMGYHDGGKSNFEGISYQQRGWDDPHLVGYMESHDEERLMFKNLEFGNSSADGSYDITKLNIALQRIKLAAAFFFTIPGPKMIWQFGELGYDVSIFANSSGVVPEPYGDDRYKLDPKPIRWNYLDNVNRVKLYKTFAALINLRRNYEAFNTDNFILGVGGAVKRIRLNHETMNVNIIGNFDVKERTTDGIFQNTGTWYDYFSGDSLEVADMNMDIILGPGEFHIYTTEKLPAPEDDILTDIKEYNEQTVNEYRLYQNYPNPFNPSTVIGFQLAAGAHVELVVYDILGREVKTLVNKKMTPGRHEVKFDASGLASGVYFYSLKTDKFTQNRKMIIMR